MAASAAILTGTIKTTATADRIAFLGIANGALLDISDVNYINSDLKAVVQSAATLGDGTVEVTLYYYEVDMPSA